MEDHGVKHHGKSSPARRRVIGLQFGKKLPWFIASVVLVLLIGTYFFGKAASLAETRGEPSAETGTGSAEASDSGGLFATGSAWEIQSSTDPMTDATVSTAAATFGGSQFDVQVTVICTSAGDIAFSATTFDKEGQPAEMRSQMRTSGYDGITRLFIPFEIRADNDPAIRREMQNPEYNNQVALKSAAVAPLYPDGSGGDDAEKMAAATNVVLRLFMTSGEETIQWRQDDASFRNLVRPCLEQREAIRAKLTREQDEELRRREAEYNERVRRMDEEPEDAVTAM